MTPSAGHKKQQLTAAEWEFRANTATAAPPAYDLLVVLETAPLVLQVDTPVDVGLAGVYRLDPHHKWQGERPTYTSVFLHAEEQEQLRLWFDDSRNEYTFSLASKVGTENCLGFAFHGALEPTQIPPEAWQVAGVTAEGESAWVPLKVSIQARQGPQKNLEELPLFSPPAYDIAVGLSKPESAFVLPGLDSQPVLEGIPTYLNVSAPEGLDGVYQQDAPHLWFGARPTFTSLNPHPVEHDLVRLWFDETRGEWTFSLNKYAGGPHCLALVADTASNPCHIQGNQWSCVVGVEDERRWEQVNVSIDQHEPPLLLQETAKIGVPAA